MRPDHFNNSFNYVSVDVDRDKGPEGRPESTPEKALVPVVTQIHW